MSKFGRTSKNNLQGCHVDLQLILNTAIKICDFKVIKGHRNEEKQNKAFKDLLSKLEWPNSKHNELPSKAADVIPYPLILNGKNVWKEENHIRFYHLAGIIQGIAYSLYWSGKITHLIRWGGDFNGNFDFTDQSWHDLPHIELYQPE